MTTNAHALGNGTDSYFQGADSHPENARKMNEFVTVALTLMLLLSGSIQAARDIPVSPAGHLGQFNLSDKDYIMGFRFLLDEETTIDRFYFAINGEGSDCVGGRTGYGSGNGGIHYGRIVTVDPSSGFPTNKVLASERVGACEAYKRAQDEFNPS
jgi:hypothetical protein